MSKAGEKMTLGQLEALPDNSEIWVTYVPHGSDHAVINEPVKMTRSERGWHVPGLTFDPREAVDYVWTPTAPLDWWSADGHITVKHVA